jgi:hypothetical protein
MPECYIRGNSIKYLRIPDEVISLVNEDEIKNSNFLIRILYFSCTYVILLIQEKLPHKEAEEGAVGGLLVE